MAAKILVIGSSSMDLVVTASKRPESGETILGESFETVPGGKGANQAVAAARLGAEVYFAGCIGDDLYGKAILANLQANGVRTDFVNVLSGEASGTAHIVLAEGDNSIIVVQGTNKKVTPPVADAALEVLKEADLVLIQQEIPEETVEHVCTLCKEHGVRLLLNPAPARPVSDAVLDAATFLTPNETEARFLFGADEALKTYPNKLIITQGSNGVRYHSGEKIEIVPAFPVNPVDTTGAGDTFNAAFAVAMAEGKALHDALLFANRAASISVTKFGAQGGMPYRAEVEG